MGFRMDRVLIILTLTLSGCLEITEHVANPPESGVGSEGGTNGGSQGLPDQLQGPPVLGQVTGDETPVLTPEEINPMIIINGGNPYVSSLTFELSVLNPRAYQFRASQTGECAGNWLATSTVLTLPVIDQNSKNAVWVQFRDPDFLPSECFKVAVIHDGAAPQIVFNKVPSQSVEIGDTATIGFYVTDAGVGVATVLCRYNGNDVPCATLAEFSYQMNQTGSKTFEVEAVDLFGHRSVLSVQWSATNATQNIVQTLAVDDNFKVDILFVIDNSGSMAYEQNNMADRISSFIDQIQLLDWQIGVITTDPRNVSLGDGRLIELAGLNDQYVLTQANGGNAAQTILGATLQRPETGSPYEQGIRATYRALERAADPGSSNSMLIRDDAGLAVVVISDEDESASGSKNDPQNLLSFIDTTWNSQKNFGFHSIITKPDDNDCLNGHGAKYGHRYSTFSQLTGGIIGSVCETDYTSQLTGMGAAVAEMKRTVTLSCAPITGPGYFVEVFKDGVAYPGGFTVDGVKLIFDQFLLAGEYKFTFQCLQ